MPSSLDAEMQQLYAEIMQSRKNMHMSDYFIVEPSMMDKGSNPVSGPKPSDRIVPFIKSVAHAVTWDSIIGNDLAKQELREAVEARTTHAHLYEFYQMTPPMGVLLYGPPGCGKTMLGKAVTTALGGDQFILINGPELQQKYVGETEATIRELFAYAADYMKHHKKPLVIFIDEADAALPSRTTAYGYQTDNVAAFLAEMDGLKSNGAFVILATNRPNELDEALLRDGRCDRKIKITRPSRKAIEHMLDHQLDQPRPWAPTPYRTDAIIEALFSNDYLLRELVNPQTGAKHRFLLAHILNGAMVMGLLARAKSLAFRRDIASGKPSGVTTQDMLDAVAAVYAENSGLNHDFALREFIDEVALPAEALKNLN